MLVTIRDVRGSKDQLWIRDIYGEYLDSLSDLNTGLFSVIGADNPRQDEIFATWFSNDQAHPLIILKAAQPVGFALVTRVRAASGADNAAFFRMSEFFIRKEHRRLGIGRDAATLMFDRFAGDWQLVEYQRHPGAIAFWRRVLARYCKGDFSERSRNGEVQQHFRSRPPAHR